MRVEIITINTAEVENLSELQDKVNDWLVINSYKITNITLHPVFTPAHMCAIMVQYQLRTD